MPEPTWEWDGKRYHDTSTGRFVGPKDFVRLRDEYIDLQQYQVSNISEMVADGSITREEFIGRMRESIRSTYVNEYALGRGGTAQVSREEWLQVARDCKAQYRYLNRFADQIEAARAAGHPMSPEYIANRAKMYIDSATKEYERSRAKDAGVPSLPAYPGDGQTVCTVNCRCHWHIEETETGWDCTWMLGQAEHCTDCLENADKWNPLQIERAE
jgi:hypothetical protein